jgi:hypothetical protein
MKMTKNKFKSNVVISNPARRDEKSEKGGTISPYGRNDNDAFGISSKNSSEE